MEFLENSVDNAGKRGSIEVIAGSMFSGKTEELITEASAGDVCRAEG